MAYNDAPGAAPSNNTKHGSALLLRCRNNRPSSASRRQDRKITTSSSASSNINDDEYRVAEPPLPTPADVFREREDGQRGRFLPASASMALPSCFSVARKDVEVNLRTSRSATQQDSTSERPRPDRQGNPNRLRNGLLQATSPARGEGRSSDDGGGGVVGGGGGGGGVSRGQDMGAVALLLLAASKASPRPSNDGRGMSVRTAVVRACL